MNFRKLILYILLAAILIPFLITHCWIFIRRWPWPELIPQSLGFRGWEYFFSTGSGSLAALGRSFLISAAATALTLLISFPAAKALGCREFPGKRVIKGLILLPVIIPMLSAAMGIHLCFIAAGLANTVWGVILIHIIPGLPYGVKILMNIFEIHGEKLETQARVLGAGKIQVLRHITLPLLAPGLITAGSLIYIISFSQYFITFLIGGGNVVTLAIQMFPFIESGDRTMAATYSFIFIISILSVLFIADILVHHYYRGTTPPEKQNDYVEDYTFEYK